MTVAGSAAVDIAERLHTLPDNITAFQLLFFDVSAYISNRTALSAILEPMLDPRTAIDARERVWMLAALMLGAKGLDYVMDQKMKLSHAEQDEINETIHAILAEQTLVYALSMQSNPDAGPKVLNAYYKGHQMRLRNATTAEDERSAEFTKELIETCKRNMPGASG